MAKKILVVDDEQDIAAMMALRLGAAGYEVITAFDGQEGYDKARKELPDLIILDVMLPKMEGWKVCGLIKADARYRNMKVLLFTAKAESEGQQLSQQVRADGYINKPFDPPQMLARIKEQIGE